MKTLKTILLIALTIFFVGCDNDDNNNPNLAQCNYSGLTSEDTAGNIITQIPESQLQTDYFPNNDGPGQPAVEIFETTNPGNNYIVTRALTVGAVDNNPQIVIAGTSYTGVVTCQRVNAQVGGELRFDIVLSGGGEAELCVVIDRVTP